VVSTAPREVRRSPSATAGQPFERAAAVRRAWRAAAPHAGRADLVRPVHQ
jgi:hypothetical protein